MRYFKLFEDFFGDNLWNDLSYPERSRGLQASYQMNMFSRYITQMYDRYEQNTYKEDALLLDIEEYLAQGDRTVGRNINLIKKLLKYKKLYPEMLDPAQSLNKFDMLFRGMTMHFNEVHNAINTCDRIVKIGSLGREYILLKGAKTKVSSRNDMGFISASTSLSTATSFQQMEDDRWPIIAAASFGKIENKCIMNPEWLNILNPMDESETWILGNEIEAQDIYLMVLNPKQYASSIRFEKSKPYQDLMERIWRMWDDVRIKKVKE